MRRLSVVLAGAMMILPAFSQSIRAEQAAPAAAQPAAAQPAAQPAAPKTTLEGDTAIILYASNPGKDADYEQVIAKLREALGKSTDPQAKEQAKLPLDDPDRSLPLPKSLPTSSEPSLR